MVGGATPNLWVRDDILRSLSVFNHCDVIGLQSYWTGRNYAK